MTNDPIERLLRHDARIAVDDAGFSARVMAAIPRQAPRTQSWLKPALVMGSATLGSLLAIALAPQGAVISGFKDLMALHASSPAAIGGLAMCGALLVSAVVLALEE